MVGEEKVLAMRIQTKYGPLVRREPFEITVRTETGTSKISTQKTRNNFFVITGVSTDEKVAIINRISQNFNLGYTASVQKY